ncbi:hypothetical protein FOH10_00655 [Nocardia otitidiscaviarum]|uniref:Uncharacterized protein n=1 Tax=Nocardia otitidiscaviarum TaxID=1823 RepID=A0A516NF18_9NOCA|nr:hypothetical protein [Nocardia otitidiscaviarum]MCP9622729.1 hypothetical protein [Nocardia otitidiscaviarum]QDP77467.1 hypothetical protein FOH10_00655 [Nocardia otitidiscaviarum]
MDADYTSDLGHTLTSRSENYRLTNPDASDSRYAANSTLTGVDTGGHAALGRLSPPEAPAQWSNSGSHRTAEPESAQQNSRPADFRSEFAPINGSASATARTDFGNGTPDTAQSAHSGGSPATGGSAFGGGSSASGNSGFGGSAPGTGDSVLGGGSPATGGSAFGGGSPATGNSGFGGSAPGVSDSVLGGGSPASGHSAFSGSTSSSEGSAFTAGTGRGAASGTVPTASAPGTWDMSTSGGSHSAPPPADRPTRARERQAAAASGATVEPQHVMRLLLASHELDTAATKAESGEITVAELARAAHRTRAAAVELVSAWYGGADQMRNFAEALLQAASEGTGRH